MNRAELVTKLELVGRGLADTNLVPVFQCFAFDGKQVLAYNDHIGVVAPCESVDRFAIHGSTLLGLLTNSHSEDVSFTPTGQEIAVKTGKSLFKLPFLSEDAFLFTPPIEKWERVMAITPDFIAGLEACLLTTSKDHAQEALMGVCFNQQEKTIALYSCDGDAVTRYRTDKGYNGGKNYVLTNSFCETVVKLAKETNSEKSTLAMNDGWACATLEHGYVIYGRLIETKQKPDFHADLIERTIKGKLTYIPVPDELNDALSRARVVADQESAKTVLTVKGAVLQLYTETHMGVIRDTIKTKHPEVEANVSAELLQRAIGLCEEIAIMDNCCALRQGDRLFLLLSNMNG